MIQGQGIKGKRKEQSLSPYKAQSRGHMTMSNQASQRVETQGASLVMSRQVSQMSPHKDEAFYKTTNAFYQINWSSPDKGAKDSAFYQQRNSSAGVEE